VKGWAFFDFAPIKLTFIDSSGAHTVLNVTAADIYGNLSVEVTIPAGAALGSGLVKATEYGRERVTSRVFTVT
jgi:hypothetical protein